jgi:hypothetical protein
MTTLHALPRIAPAQDTLDSLLIDSLPPHIAERITIAPSGCWITSGHHDRYGYARLGDRLLHRVVYELLVGPIPPGLSLDHLCHTRDLSCPGGDTCPHHPCVCPLDLEPVPAGINTLRGRSFSAVNARKRECDHGHRYDAANTYVRPNGHRDCRACIRDRVRRYQAGLRQRGRQQLGMAA